MARKRLVRREYKKGATVFKEGSFSKGVYIVRKGKVKVYQTSPDGKQAIVYFYSKGEYFGYRPLLSDEPNPVSAVAVDNCVISFLSRDVFLSLLEDSETFARQMLINLSREFSVWINKLTVFSQYGVRERVALSLLILGRVYMGTQSSQNKMTLTISREDLAGFVGTAKETLVRMLRHFKDEKIISSKGSKIVILKPAALKAYIKGF